MPPFPSTGDQARWRTIYDQLKKTDIGDVVTYERLGHALGLDPVNQRHTIQLAIRRAAKEYEQADKRALDAVPNEGYRVVPASEHLALAKRHQGRSTRSLERGHSVAVNVDLSTVDEQTRRALETVATAFAVQMDFNRRLDVRQRRLEQVVAAQSVRTDRTEAELAALRAELDELKNAP